MSNDIIAVDKVREIFKEMFSSHEANVKNMIAENIKAINTRMDTLATKINNTEKNVTELTTKVNETKNEVSQLMNNTNFFDNELEKIRKYMSDVKTDLKHYVEKCQQKCNELEDRSRRNNLRIDGLSEGDAETWDETEKKVKNVFSKKLNVQNVRIERAHRVGKKTEERHRTIVLKMLDYKEKEMILSKASQLKNTGIYINEDFCADTLLKRKSLWEQVKMHRKNGKFATVRYDKLIVREFKKK